MFTPTTKLFKTQRDLSGKKSILLDLVRFSAALTVFITHAFAVWFPQSEFQSFPSNISHGAVVVFFVLSGFVIAHTTTKNRRNLREYASARLSRLYSIYLPALVITVICWVMLRSINFRTFQLYCQPNLTLRYLVSLFYCNELWFLSSAPIFNGPIWSLSYEFWYYIIFGAFFYKTPGKKGYVIPFVICLIAGPKILLMMLMWILGWFAYHIPNINVNNAIRWVIIIILISVSFVLMIYLPSWPNHINTTHLHWADKFLTDWIVSVFVAIAVYLLPRNSEMSSAPSIIVLVFRKLGDLTFPIYVLHFPLLIVIKEVISKFNMARGQSLLGIIMAFAACSFLGFFLDSYRNNWNRLFKKLVNIF